MHDEPPLLKVERLRSWLKTERGVVRAVDGVDLELRGGETLGLVGESGSGKSVLARSLLGLNPKAIEMRPEGRVLYRGEDLRAMPEREMRRWRGRELAMIFQDPMTSLNPVMTVGRQIGQVLRHQLGSSRAQAAKGAIELLQEVGIPSPEERAGQYPHQLSGGMRQRVMIAMAVACRPRLLLADEPTTALDVTVQAQILRLLRKMQSERDMALILITHDLGVVAEVADSIAVMYAGHIVEYGPAREVLANPRMPYTRGLLDCVPAMSAPSHSRLAVIPGRPPPLIDPPPGCRFADRCPRVQEDCRQRPPPLSPGDASHRFACFHPLPANGERR